MESDGGTRHDPVADLGAWTLKLPTGLHFPLRLVPRCPSVSRTLGVRNESPTRDRTAIAGLPLTVFSEHPEGVAFAGWMQWLAGHTHTRQERCYL